MPYDLQKWIMDGMFAAVDSGCVDWVTLLCEKTRSYQLVHCVATCKLIVESTVQPQDCSFETLPEGLYRDVLRIQQFKVEFRDICKRAAMLLVLKNSLGVRRPALYENALQMLIATAFPDLDALLPLSETECFMPPDARNALLNQLRNCGDHFNAMHKLT